MKAKVGELSSVNRWQDLNALISWFKSKSKNKSKCIFMQFDIDEFCLLIFKNLLLKAIDYTKGFVNISDDETKTIMHSRKFLIFSGTDGWIKEDGDKDFGVTKDSFDGAVISKVYYILRKLGEKYGKEKVGLYRETVWLVLRIPTAQKGNE